VGAVHQGIEQPYHGGGCVKPHGKEGNDISRQKSVRKGVKKIEGII
jgi:hypothetical protein